MTDDTKDPRRQDPDLETVDDLGAIDVPEAPEDAAPATGDAAPVRRPVRDIYDVTGRARPQRIEPKAPEPVVEPEPEAAPEPEVAEDPLFPEPEADETRTAVFAAGAAQGGAATDASGDAAEDVTDDAAEDAGEAVDPDSETTVFDPLSIGAYADPDAGEGYGTAVLGASAAAGYGAVADGDHGGYGPDADPDAVATADGGAEDGAGREPATPRGTLDLGLLLLRVLVGVLLILRGAQTLFGFGGDPGVDALESRLAAFSGADILAVGVPVAEIVGGGLLLLGLLTPIGGAVALAASGFMGLFELSLSDAGYWPYQMSQNAQVWGILGLLGLVLVFTGPGRYSADTGRGWATRPRASAWLWAVIGLGGAAALWLLTGGGNPF